ncbi:MAG: hypothetical protein ABFD25_05690 [Clostridiaceae bacterium]
MNHLERFAQLHDFKFDKKQAWGECNGYQFTIGLYTGDNILTILTSVACDQPEDGQKLDAFLEGMKAAKEIRSYENKDGSLKITKTKVVGQVSAEEIEEVLSHLAEEFRSIGAKPSCYNCSNEGIKDFARYNGIILPMCEACYTSVSSGINQAMQEHESTKNNYGAGMLGAILGALLGSVLWVVIGLLGYIASIAGFAISAAAAKGYTLLKGKITRMTPWIIGISSILALVLAQFVTLDLSFYKELRNQGYDLTIKEALSITFELPFTDPEITAGFLKDFGLGLIFAVLGAYSTFKKLAGISKRPAGSIEKA